MWQILLFHSIEADLNPNFIQLLTIGFDRFVFPSRFLHVARKS